MGNSHKLVSHLCKTESWHGWRTLMVAPLIRFERDDRPLVWTCDQGFYQFVQWVALLSTQIHFCKLPPFRIQNIKTIPKQKDLTFSENRNKFWLGGRDNRSGDTWYFSWKCFEELNIFTFWCVEEETTLSHVSIKM